MKSEVTVYVRPVRHAYFILADDLERFIDVVSFCCTQWGGINNLIIPVSITYTDDKRPQIHIDQRFRDALQRHKPLFFIDAASDRYECDDYTMLPQVVEQMQTYVRSLMPDAYLQMWEVFKLIDDALHPLHILPSTPLPERQSLSRAVIPDYQPVAELERAAIFAAFGRIWPDQEEDYTTALEVSMWPAVVPDLVLSAQCDILSSTSVINFTRFYLHNLGSDQIVFDKHFHVVVAKTCVDLCWYWEMRVDSFGLYQLYDRRILLVTKDQLLSSDYFEPLIRLIRARCSHPTIESNLDVLFHHDDNEIEAYLAARPELMAHEGPIHSSARLAFGKSEAMGTENVSEAENAETDGGEERHLSFVQRHEAEALYLFELPTYFDYGGHPSTYSLELTEGPNEHLVPGFGVHTAQWSSVWLSISGAFLDHIPFLRGIGGLLVQQQGVLERRLNTTWLSYRSYLSPGNSERINITLPPFWDLYQTYFGFYGHAVDASDKMAYVNGLLELAGGLEGARALRSRLAYHMLDLLADKSSKKLAQAVKAQLQDAGDITTDAIEQAITTTGVLPRYQRNPRAFIDVWSSAAEVLRKQVDKARALNLLGELVRMGAVQRGFNVRCPRCSVVSWFGIGAIDEKVTCPGCLGLFMLPLKEGDNAKQTDRPMEYSLNPLANRAMDQDVLPVILALLTLRTVHSDMVNVVPGMAFKLHGNAQADGDFDFIYTRKSELYTGECKAGDTLTEKDMATMRVAESVGARAFFFVSMTAFNPASLQLIENAKAELRENRPETQPFGVFVLNGSMLFGEEQLPPSVPR